MYETKETLETFMVSYVKLFLNFDESDYFRDKMTVYLFTDKSLINILLFKFGILNCEE